MAPWRRETFEEVDSSLSADLLVAPRLDDLLTPPASPLLAGRMTNLGQSRIAQRLIFWF